MRSTSLAAFLAAAIVLVVPTGALAKSPPLKRELVKYSRLYSSVRHVHGSRVPGRNIRRQGVRTPSGVRPATAAEVGRSIRTFRRWLAPPMGHAARGDATASNPAYAGGRWAIPAYIVRCESGGNYHARNPSGAGGAYQIMPGTWHAYGGTGDPASAPPAEQDRVAGRIYAAQGAAPWVCG